MRPIAASRLRRAFDRNTKANQAKTFVVSSHIVLEVDQRISQAQSTRSDAYASLDCFRASVSQLAGQHAMRHLRLLSGLFGAITL